MTDRKQWKKVELIVRSVIREWDPYGLFVDGAPEDEWDSEVLQLVGRVRNIKTREQAASAISDVFSGALQPEVFKSSDCLKVGTRLFDALMDADLL